jgi:arginyl-tRNA synthetase
MNIFNDFQQRITVILLDLIKNNDLPTSIDVAKFSVEPPRDAAHGDISTNAAMVYAKEAGVKPRDLAEKIVSHLSRETGVLSVEIAGPSFINIRITSSFYEDVLRSIMQNPAEFGRGKKRPEKVNIEYVSANPTGPMHVGHGRGAVFGDALASILDFGGADVTREYYINDAGAQVDVLARSSYLRYREALGINIGAIPEGLYPGDYLIALGKILVVKYGNTLLNKQEAEWLPLVRQIAIDAMMDMIREDLAQLQVRHSVFFSERSLQKPIDEVGALIADLRSQGIIYDGRLPPPKGQVDEDYDDREQALFASTRYGDDVDRPLIKSDGSYTYFASDIAYHASKFKRGFTKQIDVWGADHGGYVKRMQAAVKAVSDGKAVLDVKLCQMVKLMRNGEPVKMSKRSGDFVTLREVIDEVGCDAARFMMLFRKNDATLEFDLAKVIEQSKDNPVFYVQYAYARCCSIFKQAAVAFPDADFSVETLQKADLSLLSDDAERGVMRLMAEYPRLIEAASAACEPHRVAFYLYDLASSFHSLWNRGKDQHSLRFVNQDDGILTTARLSFVYSLKSVLASGLGILGVSAPEEMR